MADLVQIERDGAVALVTLNRPEVINALNGALGAAFAEAMLMLEADESARCIVLRGAGRGFMAGGDIASFHAKLDDGIEDHIRTLIGVYHGAVRAIVRMPKPTIASLHGAVAGAGLSLALNTDLAIAADNAVFTLAYSNLGTSPDGGATHFLPRLVGRRKAMEIALLSDRFDAAQALDLGLVNKVVPAAELERETMAWAQRLAAGPTRAYAATKKLLAESFENSLSAQLDAELEAFAGCSTTADFREGVTAFVGKRKPIYEGR